MALGLKGASRDTVGLSNAPLGGILHEALTDGAQLLLLGAMLIGVLAGDSGQAAMKPFSVDLFKGMLTFFLLDMGLLAARNMGKLRGQSAWLLVYAIAWPTVHVGIALLHDRALGMSPGDVALLMVLARSAYYIAVPAVIRHAIPEANTTLFNHLSPSIAPWISHRSTLIQPQFAKWRRFRACARRASKTGGRIMPALPRPGDCHAPPDTRRIPHSPRHPPQDCHP